MNGSYSIFPDPVGSIGRFVAALRVRLLYAKREALQRLHLRVTDELANAEHQLQSAALSQLGIWSDPLQYTLRHCDEGMLRMDPRHGSGLDYGISDPDEAILIRADGVVAREGRRHGAD